MYVRRRSMLACMHNLCYCMRSNQYERMCSNQYAFHWICVNVLQMMQLCYRQEKGKRRSIVVVSTLDASAQHWPINQHACFLMFAIYHKHGGVMFTAEAERLFPQTRRHYRVKSRAAFSVTFDLHCKAIAAVFFIPYCRPT